MSLSPTTGLLIGTIFWIGCSGETTPPAALGPASGHAASGAPELLETMPTPDLAILISGQLDGFLEPCGCTKGTAGGLVRRYELLERMRSRGWPIAAIDLGGLLGEEAVPRIGLEQARIKLEYTTKAMRLLGYSAVALEAGDLRVGVKDAMAIYRDHLKAAAKIVVANVRATEPFEAVVRPSVVINAGALKLGVTAVIDPGLLETIDARDKAAVFAVIEAPGVPLPRVLAELESESDYQALMVQGSYELAERLVIANPGFDVVVATTDSIGARDRRPLLSNGGKTRLVTVGRRGYNVGVFTFTKGQRPGYRLVALGDQYDGLGGAVKKVIQADYRAALKEAGVVERFPRMSHPEGSPGAVYIGAKACATCHAKTFEKWETSKHARAFDSLLHDKKPDTASDVECIRCHTTGFPDESGWRSEAVTAYLAGNQCENCHGPGSRHAAAPDELAYRRPMAVAGEPARRVLCLKCHDHENSPDFDLARYWSKIVHQGLDDRLDPKRHRGINNTEP